MSIDVPKSIARLLYEQPSVGIPGLGNIISTYRSASIDRVQGLLHPPAKNLRFDDNEQVSDEQLLRYLQKEYSISLDEARMVVTQFVSDIKSALDRREIFLIPEVGRIYKDYEHRYQFLQDSTNFNLEVFGLPTIQFYPILRSKDSIFREADPPVARPQKNRLKSLTDALPNLRVSAAMAAGLMGLALTTALIYYGINKKYAADAQALPVAEKRLNKNPVDDRASIFDTQRIPEEEAALITPAETEDNDITFIEEKAPEVLEEDNITPGGSLFKTELEPDIETEASTYLPDQKECVLIIGAFSRNKGAEKRIRQIYELGFDAYRDKKNGLNRVGVQFAYETKSDIRRVTRKLKKRFDVNPWVLKK